MNKLNDADKSGLWAGLLAALGSVFLYLDTIDWNFAAIDWELAIKWIGTVTGITGGVARHQRNKPSPGQDDQSATETDKDLPLGIRNNNPGNLRPLDDGQKWKGQIGVISTVNGEYLKFSTHFYGIRAAARNLKNQQRIHDLRTIKTIVAKWAPKDDGNDPVAYAASVASKTGYGVTELLDLEDNTTCTRLLTAIFFVENGMKFYATDQIFEGVKAA